MKRVVLAAAALLFAFSASAQVDRVVDKVKDAYNVSSPRAVGVRVGYGVSLNYQHSLTDKNMLSFDLDFPGFNSFGLGITYDWLNPFNSNVPWSTPMGTWNWYLGVGLNGGADFRRVSSLTKSEILPPDQKLITEIGTYKKDAGYLGVAGRVGLEYNFDFPLQLAVEWRPVLGLSFIGETKEYKEAYRTEYTNEKRDHIGFYGTGLFSGAFALCVRYRF